MLLNKQKGFTLIELLVAVSIIALMSVTAAISYKSINTSSRDSRRKADLEQIRAALEMYRSNSNSYMIPADIDCTPGSINFGANIFLNPIPKDPLCATRSYYANISASDYTLGAALENGVTNCSGNPACGSYTCNYCVGPYGVKP
ncbi:MAG: fimbrial protein pilin [uncultured bacterium]|nr:MAG: fimbrial protein pilin [uncultured bacterium]